MVLGLMLVTLLAPLQQQECVKLGGREVCGYHCTKTGGQAACARTPYGICHAARGKVVCWDPPSHLVPFVEHQRPMCKASVENIACGYNCMTRPGKAACVQAPGGQCFATSDAVVCGFDCVESLGQWRCAQTPHGACATVLNKTLCYDPPASAYLTHGLRLQKAQCLVSQQAMDCGYNCAQEPGLVRCAKTPNGFCKVSNGQLTCFE